MDSRSCVPLRGDSSYLGINHQLSRLLTQGGDTRLALDAATDLNCYGSPPWPCPQELNFSSSTASTISERGYAAADAALRTLAGRGNSIRPEHVFEQLAEQIRHDLKLLLDLPSDTAVVLSPSGTDSVLHALYLSRRILKGALVSVVAAADETGRGVLLAAAGRHFDRLTSGGRPAVVGQPIAGLATEASAVGITGRDSHGQARPSWEIDDEIQRKVQRAVRSGFSVMVLAMDHSKTGLRCPSDNLIRDILSRHRRSVQVVVDACQARLSRARLRWYLENGCMVIVTGSKFFTGPAFSGALLIPDSVSRHAVASEHVASGFLDYSSHYDWPIEWNAVSSGLGRRMNAGSVLRWIAALEEIRAFYAVPRLFRQVAIAEFAAAMRREIVQQRSLQPVSVPASSSIPAADSDEFDSQTIHSFLVRSNGHFLPLDGSRKLYLAMSKDVSGHRELGRGFAAELAARPCHIGQPIAVGDGHGGIAGALRLSVDARMVSYCRAQQGVRSPGEAIRKTMAQIKIVLNKLSFLVAEKCEAGL